MHDGIIAFGLLALNFLTLLAVTLWHPTPDDPVYPAPEQSRETDPDADTDSEPSLAYGVSDD